MSYRTLTNCGRENDEGRLAALHEARERARDEWRAAQAAVAEAETLLREARLHSRSHLVEAYVNSEPVDAEMTEADAQVQLDLVAIVTSR